MIDSAKIVGNKLTIAVIYESFSRTKPILISCFKGITSIVNFKRFGSVIYNLLQSMGIYVSSMTTDTLRH
jgi:hypothetical protein